VSTAALTEAIQRLRRCAQRHGRLGDVRPETRSAYQLVCRLISVAEKAATKLPGHQRLHGQADARGQQGHTLHIGCLNPHKNGLTNVQGTAIAWSRIKDHEVGLVRAIRDLNLSFLGLPACRVPENFQLPVALGMELTALGGTSYASVGVLRSLEIAIGSPVLLAASTATSMVLKLEDIIFVIFALPTPSGPESDNA